MIRKEFVCKSTPQAVSRLTKNVAAYLQTWIQDAEVIFDLRLALSEACTNVVLHAYANQRNEEFTVRLNIWPGKKITIELKDRGTPFYGPKQAITECDPYDEHGRGLFIISKIMDSFVYDHSQGYNTLSLERYIQEHAWKE